MKLNHIKHISFSLVLRSRIQRGLLALVVPIIILASCKENETPGPAQPLRVRDVSVDGQPANLNYAGTSLRPTLVVKFSEPVDRESVTTGIVLATNISNIELEYSFSNGDSNVTARPKADLSYFSSSTFGIQETMESARGENLDATRLINILTQIDPADKFPRISDNELLDKVQQQTIKYFYDFAHPSSGMARERNASGNTVTSGGTGFGIMAVIAGVERDFVPRAGAIQHFNKIIAYLEKADRFHGVWPHWLDGNTGKVIPFSTKDNGGDLVETSFLVQGLITLRQYLEPADTVGNNMINRINKMWKEVEWSWYRKNNENVLYWHWSPNYNWDMNFPMYGYYEQQITYILAAASPTYGVPKIVYTNGYGKNGAIVKNSTFYNIKLPLESPGPLFWVHYSYLGMDPHFSDDCANYWEQNVAATKINQAYCIANPKKFYGYSDQCWGLTSSDNQSGYSAHSPSNDLGVITPTAALSSFPYTPEESMKALKFFYYTMGDKLYGEYGFYDSFNLSKGWVASSYLAIDQGPIVVMIENHRSGLLWNLFMSAPEIQNAKTVLGLH